EAGAERAFAAAAAQGPRQALDAVLAAVEDDVEVHRVVLPYRAYQLLGAVGTEHAHTLLRQSLRYCLRARTPNPAVATTLAHALETHGLIGRPLGRSLEGRGGASVGELTRRIFEGTPEEAAGVAAAALAAGTEPSNLA